MFSVNTIHKRYSRISLCSPITWHSIILINWLICMTVISSINHYNFWMYKKHGLELCPSQQSAECKHEEPIRMLAGWYMSATPWLATQWQEDSWGSLASQTSLIGKVRADEEPLYEKTRWTASWRTILKIDLGFHMYTHVCANPHKDRRSILSLAQLLEACVSIFKKRFNRKLTKISCSNC